jgi:hypothetical protein
MHRSALPALAIAIMAFAAPASAQPPENGDGRFTYHRATDDGYWRLDSRTGQVSMCQRRQSGWQCQVVPDERNAMEAEIARLQGENAALKKELLSRNIALPDGIRADPLVPGPNAHRPQSRDEAEVNRVMTMIDRVWRRLVDMIHSVQRDIFKRI